MPGAAATMGSVVSRGRSGTASSSSPHLGLPPSWLRVLTRLLPLPARVAAFGPIDSKSGLLLTSAESIPLPSATFSM
jgi:hypothetical protein